MNFPRLTFGIALLASLSACSAKGGNGGGGFTDPDGSTPGDSAVVPSGTCTALCARVVTTAGCSSDTADCMTGCATLFASPACSAQSSAFAACANTATITCSGDTPNFGGCESQQTALFTCLTTMPAVDASVTPDAVVTPDVPVGPDSTVTPDVPVSPDVPVGPDSTVTPDVPSDPCSRVCARLAGMAQCSAAFSSCSSQCGTLSSVPPACVSAVNSFFACASESPVTCSGSSANFTACTAQQNAVLSCLSGPIDSGVPDVPTTGDPTVACTTTTWSGTSRECNWRRGGTFSCTPGRSYTVGCNSTAGTTAPCTSTLGTCSGDPVLRVCAGSTACSESAAIADSDDDCGTCPVTTAVCPSSGQMTILTGSYDTTRTGTCTPAIR